MKGKSRLKIMNWEQQYFNILVFTLVYKLTLTPEHSIEKYKYFTLGEVGEGVGQLRVGERVGQLRVGVEELKKLFGVIWGWQNKVPNYNVEILLHLYIYIYHMYMQRSVGMVCHIHLLDWQLGLKASDKEIEVCVCLCVCVSLNGVSGTTIPKI